TDPPHPRPRHPVPQKPACRRAHLRQQPRRAALRSTRPLRTPACPLDPMPHLQRPPSPSRQRQHRRPAPCRHTSHLRHLCPMHRMPPNLLARSPSHTAHPDHRSSSETCCCDLMSWSCCLCLELLLFV